MWLFNDPRNLKWLASWHRPMLKPDLHSCRTNSNRAQHFFAKVTKAKNHRCVPVTLKDSLKCAINKTFKFLVTRQEEQDAANSYWRSREHVASFGSRDGSQFCQFGSLLVTKFINQLKRAQWAWTQVHCKTLKAKSHLIDDQLRVVRRTIHGREIVNW